MSKTEISVKNGVVIFAFPDSQTCKEVRMSISGVATAQQNGTINPEKQVLEVPLSETIPFVVSCGTIQVMPSGWTIEEFHALIWPD